MSQLPAETAVTTPSALTFAIFSLEEVQRTVLSSAISGSADAVSVSVSRVSRLPSRLAVSVSVSTGMAARIGCSHTTPSAAAVMTAEP